MREKRQLLPLIAIDYFIGPEKVATLFLSLISLALYRSYREYIYSVAVYQKYLTGLGELIIFEHWGENYHFSQTS